MFEFSNISPNNQPPKQKIKWPSSGASKNKIESKSDLGDNKKPRRDSVNIRTMRKESKKFMKSSNVKMVDKAKWNSPYPIIEYNE